jgi:homoserine O-acetyltransferase
MNNTNYNLEYILKLNDFNLHYGGVLNNLKVRYSIYGNISLPIIVVLGGISANHKVSGEDGWWNKIVGAQKAIDTEKHCVISIEYYSSVKKPNLKQKLISSFDQARLIKQLLNYLNISKIQAIIGSSYGGMVALAFGELYSDYTDQIVCICAAHRNSIKSIALREVQRNIVKITSLSKEGVALARSLAMIGYRGEEEFEERFSTEPKIYNGKTNFDVSHYLNYNGMKFAESFDTNRYINLSNSIDIHKVDPTKISAQTLLIPIDSDQLVPKKIVKELQLLIKGQCRIESIHSKYGHDGFLLEDVKIGKIIKKFINIENSNEQ